MKLNNYVPTSNHELIILERKKCVEFKILPGNYFACDFISEKKLHECGTFERILRMACINTRIRLKNRIIGYSPLFCLLWREKPHMPEAIDASHAPVLPVHIDQCSFFAVAV